MEYLQDPLVRHDAIFQHRESNTLISSFTSWRQIMNNQLVLLRFIGFFLGIIILFSSFSRFQQHITKRHEFFWTSAISLTLMMISIFPSSVNILARMFALDNEQFGRLITLLVLSNLMIWLIIFSIRNKLFSQGIQFDLLIRKLALEKFESSHSLDEIKNITIVIPALNEAENLDVLLPQIPNEISGFPAGVLVVDDGSTDNTISIVKKHGHHVISNPINRGGGAALRLGYDVAQRAGAKIIVTMDGDGQHLPHEIERLVKPIIDKEYDFIIGSRILGHREKDSVVRWIGIHVFNFIINMLAGTKITDCSNGFRAFEMESLKKVLLLQDQFHTAELIIDAARKKIRIGEAPITVVKRLSGQSKKGKNLSYGFNFAKTILKTFFRN